MSTASPILATKVNPQPPTPAHLFSSDIPMANVHQKTSAPAPAAVPGRLVSLDAYRGLIMVLMISAGLQIGKVVKLFDSTPGWTKLHTPLWNMLAFQTDHTEWAGCSLWDLIQPSFMFMVGSALAFSVVSRAGKGQSFWRMLGHALFRSAALVLLAVFLSSMWSPHTNWSFTNVLAQIGLGYPFLFLLAWVKPRWQFVAAVVILVGYWVAFAKYPKPPADLSLASVHLPADWHRLTGFASHWEKKHDLAVRVDQWFLNLNLFPRPDGKRFTFENGGYQTLNFVPSLATMIFGLLAGQPVRGKLSSYEKVAILLGSGIAALAIGWTLDALGICPSVKRIWTPSWAIFSAGWALLAFGVFYLVLDVWKFRGWEFPLIVVGANSIGIYCVSMTLKPFVRESMKRHLGVDVFELPGRYFASLLDGRPIAVAAYGKMFAPMAEAGFFLLFCWVLCLWAYRKKLFIRI